MILILALLLPAAKQECVIVAHPGLKRAAEAMGYRVTLVLACGPDHVPDKMVINGSIRAVVTEVGGTPASRRYVELLRRSGVNLKVVEVKRK